MALKLLLHAGLDRSKLILPTFARATSYQTLGKHKFAPTSIPDATPPESPKGEISFFNIFLSFIFVHSRFQTFISDSF